MHHTPAASYRYVILALVLVAQFVVPLAMFSIAPLASLLRDLLHLSREQIGSLTAFFSAGVALIGVVAGLVADRHGVRLPWLVVQTFSGLALCGMLVCQTYHAMLVIMFLAGLASGTITVVTSKALVEWFPQERRGTVFGAKLIAFSLAGSLASVTLPLLAQWAHWRHIFAGIGGLMLASALLVWLWYRPQLPAKNPGSAPSTPVWDASCWRNRNLWFLSAVGVLFGGAHVTFITYLPLFLYESGDYSALVASGLLAQAQIAAALSRVPYGWISDRFLGGNRILLLQGMGGAALGALLMMLFLPAQIAPLVLPVVVILYGASGLAWSGMYQALAAELAGPASAGSSVGMAYSFIHVGSVVMTPFCGYLADSTGSFGSAWSVLSLGLLCGVVLLGRIRPAHDTQPAV